MENYYSKSHGTIVLVIFSYLLAYKHQSSLVFSLQLNSNHRLCKCSVKTLDESAINQHSWTLALSWRSLKVQHPGGLRKVGALIGWCRGVTEKETREVGSLHLHIFTPWFEFRKRRGCYWLANLEFYLDFILYALLQSLPPTLTGDRTHGLILAKPSTQEQFDIPFELLDSSSTSKLYRYQSTIDREHKWVFLGRARLG